MKTPETKNKKCICGSNNKITCSKCSVLKMVILLKNGNNNLKHRQPNGKLVNPVWYNHISKNNKPINVIMNAMYRRFSTSEFATITNKVIFYDNQTKRELTVVQ